MQSPDCLQSQNIAGNVKVTLQDTTKSWSIDVSPTDAGKTSDLSVMVRMKTGEIKLATMVVKL